MTFKPGDKRPEGAGRKKGSINKSALLIREKAELLGIDPSVVLLLFAGGKYQELGYESNVISPELRQKSAKDVSELMYPKLKSVEHTGADGGPMVTEYIYETAWGNASPDKDNS